MVRRDPRLLGHAQSRWTLGALAQTCDWLRVATEGGLSQLLDRLGIVYKRARSYVHSPDPHYEEKQALIQQGLLRAWYDPERYVLIFQDEMTYYRQPTLVNALEARGVVQPLARWSYSSNTSFRVVAGLNAVTGQVTYRQHSQIGIRQLTNFYAALRADYPTAEAIYLVEDNWPLHAHPDVLACLEPQEFPWPPKLPATWPVSPRGKPPEVLLPLRMMWLPTYASWANPIEKLWRWVRQKVLHLHRLSDDWQTLEQQVADVLDQFREGSSELLRYVGLLPN